MSSARMARGVASVRAVPTQPRRWRSSGVLVSLVLACLETFGRPFATGRSPPLSRRRRPCCVSSSAVRRRDRGSRRSCSGCGP